MLQAVLSDAAATGAGSCCPSFHMPRKDFKGKWEIPFEANDTRREDFYLNREQQVSVQADMMNLYLTELD